jgi:phage-related tail protein
MNDLQDDRREGQRRETDLAADSLIAELQDQVDALNSTLDDQNEEIALLREEKGNLTEQLVQLEGALQSTAAGGDDALRALATTVRTAQRNGHPDAGKHLDALLRALGAA